jgi:hypothetical protein
MKECMDLMQEFKKKHTEKSKEIEGSGNTGNKNKKGKKPLSWTGKKNKWTGLSSKWSGFQNVGTGKASDEKKSNKWSPKNGFSKKQVMAKLCKQKNFGKKKPEGGNGKTVPPMVKPKDNKGQQNSTLFEELVFEGNNLKYEKLKKNVSKICKKEAEDEDSLEHQVCKCRKIRKYAALNPDKE